MLTKILVTALVILAAYFFLRYKRNTAAALPRTEKVILEPPVDKTPAAFRNLAIGLLLIFLVGAIAFFLHGWYDDQTLLQVRVINSQTGEVVNYQAYKGDLEGRSFVTIYGQAVSIADSERMEVSERR